MSVHWEGTDFKVGVKVYDSDCHEEGFGLPFVNLLTPKLNLSAESCLPIFLLEILIFKVLIVRRLYTSFGVKRLSVLTVSPL
jgi:hypothetical protein